MNVYTAVSNSGSGMGMVRLAHVEADNGVMAVYKLTEKLTRPGREEIFEMWKESGFLVATDRVTLAGCHQAVDVSKQLEMTKALRDIADEYISRAERDSDPGVRSDNQARAALLASAAELVELLPARF